MFILSYSFEDSSHDQLIPLGWCLHSGDKYSVYHYKTKESQTGAWTPQYLSREADHNPRNSQDPTGSTSFQYHQPSKQNCYTWTFEVTVF